MSGEAPIFPVLTTLSGSINFNGCTSLTRVPLFPALASGGTITFQGCTGMSGEAPSFPVLTTLNAYASINFVGCTGLTGIPSFPTLKVINYGSGISFGGCIGMNGQAPEFPALTEIVNANLDFNGCTGLNGTVVFSALQSVNGGINFSNCTNLAGVRLNNCNVSAANWSRFNFSNTGITTVDLSGSTLSGTLDMRNLRNLTEIIWTGCTGNLACTLYTNRNGQVVFDPDTDYSVNYSN
jgi:hypothetical protein